jgi:hypothetical protein
MPIDYAKLKMDIDEVSARLHNVRGDIVESDVGIKMKGANRRCTGCTGTSGPHSR